jgi:uncharacterized protein YyaL (SSP411 family)
MFLPQTHENKPNRLQHAHNPVDWFPWSQEALDKAQAEDKPIFLSIGYSSCHWCHVMEKECFEDPHVADLMNEAFVCVKVDREERPDLDADYMAVCQAMGRNCGWPLNILLTPTLNPFFAASYIPKSSRQGLVGMLDLVPQIMQIWKTQRRHMELVGADIKSRIQAMEKRIPQKALGKEIFQEAFEQLSRDYDSGNGGFGYAPKFPRPHNLLFLLRYYSQTGEKSARLMIEETLKRMWQGGIFDQVGFGFHRYSTDNHWLVPHFEKMLYDQALLALTYTEAFQATSEKSFAEAAKETLDYVLRDLAGKDGGFYSAQDADSEGEEGKYYLWTVDQILDVLSPADAELAFHVYGLNPKGNYYEGRSLNGKNILHIAEPLDELASYEGLTLTELNSRLKGINAALFEVRKKRSPPMTDDKILADLNGLIIGALAKAGSILGETKYLEAAQKTAEFILKRMRKDGVLYHRYAKGEVAIEGFLDDYACLIYGLCHIYEATFQESYLQEATELTRTMIAKFWDTKDGGFYQTQNSQSTMPRLKQVYDGATPSGNSVALYNLLWLSKLANEPKYEAMATQMSETFADEIQGSPRAFTFFLSALQLQVGLSYNVVLVGNQKEKSTQDMLAALRRHYLPTTIIQLKTSSANSGYQQINGKATAYVCQNQTCLQPTNSIELMLKHVDVNQEKNKS